MAYEWKIGDMLVWTRQDGSTAKVKVLLPPMPEFEPPFYPKQEVGKPTPFPGTTGRMACRVLVLGTEDAFDVPVEQLARPQA